MNTSVSAPPLTKVSHHLYNLFFLIFHSWNALLLGTYFCDVKVPVCISFGEQGGQRESHVYESGFGKSPVKWEQTEISTWGMKVFICDGLMRMRLSRALNSVHVRGQNL